MIIKGLFRRYERWNPVHPTLGAFWGMGIGMGCGVGWGPGFGPEVVGYVGAGCGLGFCVGFTAAGLGIGLPANALYHVAYNGTPSWHFVVILHYSLNTINTKMLISWNTRVDAAKEIVWLLTSFRIESLLKQLMGLLIYSCPGHKKWSSGISPIQQSSIHNFFCF